MTIERDQQSLEAYQAGREDGKQEIYEATHELFTGLDDCSLDVPDRWHERPIARFTSVFDAGDYSVGMGPRFAWVLAPDQAGTLLDDLIHAHLRKKELAAKSGREVTMSVDGRDLIAIVQWGSSGRQYVERIFQMVAARRGVFPERRKIWPALHGSNRYAEAVLSHFGCEANGYITRNAPGDA